MTRRNNDNRDRITYLTRLTRMTTLAIAGIGLGFCAVNARELAAVITGAPGTPSHLVLTATILMVSGLSAALALSLAYDIFRGRR